MSQKRSLEIANCPDDTMIQSRPVLPQKKPLVSPPSSSCLQTRQEPDSVEAPTQDEASDSKHFQAIGTLQAIVKCDDTGKFFISVGERRYNLYIPRRRIIAWFKQIETTPETPLFLRVYPKCQIIPRQESPVHRRSTAVPAGDCLPQPEIRFQVVAWGTENRWEEQSGEFILKGVWQFVPQLRTPCISVYRNWDATDPTEKFKAAHLPVLMRRSDGVNPFRFNPKIPKEQLPKRYFVEGKFRLIPSKNCFGWVEDLSAPCDRLPRYKKPVKAMQKD